MSIFMTKEQKQTFTLRISSANKSELTVILCDMLLCYFDEAKNGLALLQKSVVIGDLTEVNEESISENEMALKDAFRHAKDCLRELIAILPVNSTDKDVAELVQRVNALYRYAERELIKSEAGRRGEPIENAVLVIKELRNAYAEVSKQDAGPSVMQNTEKIYAGMTYGRSSIQESSSVGGNRGFLA